MSQAEPKMRGSRPIYEVSPFILNVKVRTKKIINKTGDMMLVSQETGEITAPIAGFWSGKAVDDEPFVKLFISGVKALKELTPAGTKAFALMYEAAQSAIGKDRVYISFNSVDQNKNKMSRATFTRGFSELVEKEFLAPCVDLNWYFINPAYIFNGDRLAFVQEYRRKSKTDNQTRDLFSEASDALPPPTEAQTASQAQTS